MTMPSHSIMLSFPRKRESSAWGNVSRCPLSRA
jgi:hypothetical protein